MIIETFTWAIITLAPMARSRIECDEASKGEAAEWFGNGEGDEIQETSTIEQEARPLSSVARDLLTTVTWFPSLRVSDYARARDLDPLEALDAARELLEAGLLLRLER